MKFCFLLLIIPLIHVSALTKAQNITINKQNVSLAEVFRELRKQTDYDFIYSAKQLANAKKVSLNVTNSQLTDVLEKCFTDQPLTYTIYQKTITIKEQPASFLDRIMDRFAAIDVQGIVHDEQGLPLAGATVKVKSSAVRTSTDSQGRFSIQNIAEEAVLVISYIGYQTKEITAAPDVGTIKLEAVSGDLNEIEINAGYYTVKDRERTGSISRVASETIEKQPVLNPLQALQGRMPGVEITQMTGIPGGGFSVQIRGKNGIGNAGDPFYLIDGVPFSSARLNNSNSIGVLIGGASPLSLINPNDIASIEVLKDADATAIYGSRGANGVVLITTKKGRIGSLKVNANVSQGLSQVGHRLKLMNTQQYLEMRNEAFANDKLTPSTTDYDVNGTWDQSKYTDWQDELIGGTAPVTIASLGVSGGSMNSSYLVSGSYYKEGTVFPGNFGLTRGGVHTNLNFGSSEGRFKASFNGTYNLTSNNLLYTDLTQLITLSPNHPDFLDQHGMLNWEYNGAPIQTNPYASLYNTIDANTNTLVGNANISYRILNNLFLKASLGYNSIKREELAKRPNIGRSPTGNPTSANRESQFGNNFTNSWIAEPQLNYDRKVWLGRLSALIGMSFQRSNNGYRNITASNFNSDELMENIQSASVFAISESTYTNYNYAALFTRLNYNINDRYYLNLTGRRDGSSRFGPGRQFANFGAIGAAWIFSDEDAFKNALSFLSFGKLRTSYGITGADQIPDYGYLQLYTSSATYQGSSTIIINRLANNDYGWEVNKKFEAALQLGFLKDKITLQAGYFRNQSSSLLLLDPVPPSVGANGVTGNLPAKVQNTGWEFDSTIKLLNRQDWEWQASINLTVPKNKLLEYPNLSMSGNASRYLVGQSLDIRRYYNSTVDTETGLYTVEDYNANGLRDDEDKYKNVFIGQFFYGGFQNIIRYKQLNLDFLISFTKQNGDSYLNQTTNIAGFFNRALPAYNQLTVFLNRWQNPGDVTEIPKFGTTAAGRTNFNIGKTDGVQSFADASYIRLRNISLSYSLPSQWLTKVKISAMELNLQGQNIFTLTKYLGLDPETQVLSRLPTLRVLSMGLKLTF